jgi:hypothetical protein
MQTVWAKEIWMINRTTTSAGGHVIKTAMRVAIIKNVARLPTSSNTEP